MGRVGDGAYGLAYHVHLPVSGLALGNERVQSPGGSPHYVGARLVVGGVLHGYFRAVNERAQQALGDVVARVVVIAREILLENVRHDVVEARHHLVSGQGIGELGV